MRFLQDWRGSRFMFVYRRGDIKIMENTIGLEVGCTRQRHVKCRKRLHFNVGGGHERTERLLKAWLLRAATDKPKHLALFETIGEPPSLEHLEAQEFESLASASCASES